MVPSIQRQLVIGGIIALLLVGALAARRQAAPQSRSVPAPLAISHAGARDDGTQPEGQLLVDVAGAVRAPGVISLPEGARVRDAIAKAGGALPRAELSSINRAARVVDGQQIVVPTVGASSSGGVDALSTSSATAPVSINAGSAAQLDTLPGIGPATAASIVADREEHGAFASIDELDRVSGIGPATIESLRDFVTT